MWEQSRLANSFISVSQRALGSPQPTAYIPCMNSLLAFLLGTAMLCTLLVLVIGVVSFAVHGEFYRKNSNKLMRLRVLLQGLAILFFAVLLFAILDY